MKRFLSMPSALTIAGSDSGGGAGIQADLKTFASLGVHGTSAITCLTAQNPRGVRGIQAATPAMVRQQIEAVFAELPPKAVKTGMLFSTPIIREVAKFFRHGTRPALVWTRSWSPRAAPRCSSRGPCAPCVRNSCRWPPS
jgi:hydroxymethylpyrimidine kinase/phosphomethylpyrimidine kinase